MNILITNSTLINMNQIDVKDINRLGENISLQQRYELSILIADIWEYYSIDEGKIIVKFLLDNNIVDETLYRLFVIDFYCKTRNFIESLNIPNIPRRNIFQKLFSI